MKTTLIKKSIFGFLCAVFGVLARLPSVTQATSVPSFDRNFRNPLIKSGAIYDAKEHFNLDRKESLKNNISQLFSPDNNNSIIRKLIKQLIIGITILFIAWA